MGNAMSIKKRLSLLVGTAVLALLTVVAVAIVELRESAEMLGEVADVRLPSIVGLEIVKEGQTAIRSENRLAAGLAANADKSGEISKVIDHKQTIWARIDKGWKIYEPLPQTKEEEALWKQFLQEWETWKAAEKRIGATLAALSATKGDDARQSAMQTLMSALEEATAPFARSAEALDKVVDINIRIAEETRNAAHASSTHEMMVLIAISLVALAVLLALGTRMATSILCTLGGEPDDARAMVQRIAAGDLRENARITPGDNTSLMAHQQKMQDSLRAMVTEISATVGRTEESAHALAGASQQVAAASEGTSESAASMAAAVEQMSVSISQVSDNTRAALGTAERTGQLSLNGGHVIEEAIAEINSIASIVRSTASNLGSLSESSNRISSVVQVIKDVADQTNLLALNAAIEAARAGETGRGFAVVADEVRKLAERTANATSEIGGMIDQIQHETQASVATMESAVTQVDRGVQLASQAGTAIQEIRAGVNQVVAVVNDIGGAIAEQSSASQQIAQRVEQVAQASEENNSAAQQTAMAARELTEMANKLRGAVGRFAV